MHPVNTVAHEAVLQASRRIDWRFLLPTPDLGRVACICVTDPELLESLALFSVRLDVVDSTSGHGLVAPYDLVVLRNPRRELIETACGLLRPGGWLYVEVETSMPVQGCVTRRARPADVQSSSEGWGWSRSTRTFTGPTSLRVARSSLSTTWLRYVTAWREDGRAADAC